ncbi:MAG: hypothetical protein H6714_10330 [Myxococcales bacterium]|nr:hypothetical protein [Myxococcales bacterium]
MPLPSLVLLGFSVGLAAALAARNDLCLSPRPAIISKASMAYGIFVAFLLVPISMYFYGFHGDWALLYLVDSRRIPSAFALLCFAIEALIGLGGFLLGAVWVRTQRDGLAFFAASAAAIGALAVVFLGWDRLSSVGTYEQYHGQYGLQPFGNGPVFQGALTMGLVLLLGAAYLLVRLFTAGRQT